MSQNAKKFPFLGPITTQRKKSQRPLGSEGARPSGWGAGVPLGRQSPCSCHAGG